MTTDECVRSNQNSRDKCAPHVGLSKDAAVTTAVISAGISTVAILHATSATLTRERGRRSVGRQRSLAQSGLAACLLKARPVVGYALPTVLLDPTVALHAFGAGEPQPSESEAGLA